MQEMGQGWRVRTVEDCQDLVVLLCEGDELVGLLARLDERLLDDNYKSNSSAWLPWLVTPESTHTMLPSLQGPLYKLLMRRGAYDNELNLGITEELLGGPVVLRLGEVDGAVAPLGQVVRGARWRRCTLEKGVDLEFWVWEYVREVETLR